MPIERLAHLVFAVALVVTLLAGGRMAVPEAWDKAAHFTAFSLLTLFLWRATGLPLLAIGAALFFGSVDAWRPWADATDFLANLCGALAALLFMQRKPACAESSPR